MAAARRAYLLIRDSIAGVPSGPSENCRHWLGGAAVAATGELCSIGEKLMFLHVFLR